MHIIANNDSPVLSRIRILVDLLSNKFPKASLLGKPLASEAAYGVPSY